jgi:Patatin-like phospholipase
MHENGEGVMAALGPDEVLREEAAAIHGDDAAKKVAHKTGADLYRELYGLNSTALCLSGGGIRSASFALGVIEALAVNPRPQASQQAQDGSQSLLRQFHYLSTVSGGGYIGSWLSAWIARAGYPAVWKKLVGRREHPDIEPAETAWLRAYSNYLTPKLGLFSADTWTAIALYVRNLILNWLVILPALCLLLFAIKLATVSVFWASLRPWLLIALAALGTALMVWVLRFATSNRPTCNPHVVQPGPTSDPTPDPGAMGRPEDANRNEARRVTPGADQPRFFFFCLVPALIAANCFSLYATGDHLAALETKQWPLWRTAVSAGVGGAVLYAVSWLAAVPFKTCGERRGFVYWGRDVLAWLASGAIFGVLVGLAVHLFVTVLSKQDPSILLGYARVAPETRDVLIVAIYGVPWIITAQLIAEMIFVGLTSWQYRSDADREWFGRSTGWFAAAAIVWFVVAFLILVGADLAFRLLESAYAKYASALAGLGSGIVSAVFGASSKSAATDEKRVKTRLPVNLILAVATALFLIFLVVAVSVLMDYVLLGHPLLESPLIRADAATPAWRSQWRWLWIGIAVIVVVAVFAWTHVNINRFSIHALYRNRLIRAYLGASNLGQRAPNRFTGFDDRDNIHMAMLWPGRQASWQPFHVVNMALNVVASSRLAWQERKAESFTATPLHCGTAAGTIGEPLGYRRSREYGGRAPAYADDNRHGGISLGTALAISGAAASPNMGYHSSPMVTLLLALFNVRLGWWLGNPGPPGERAYHKEGPTIAILPFITEMFGQTTDRRSYVYLSDGGHFENLGLYEMIRRRCRCIVVSDAGCDPNYGFEDLGNAVRKIAIDLGIHISFGQLRALKKRAKEDVVIESSYYAIGVIDYRTAPENNPNAENGYILYIKPGYRGTESPGIVAYANANAAFPHETTGDQFFSESQFESYRTLGFEIMDGVLRHAEENVGKIADARKRGVQELPELLPTDLRHLVKALEPDIVKALGPERASAPAS